MGALSACENVGNVSDSDVSTYSHNLAANRKAEQIMRPEALNKAAKPFTDLTNACTIPLDDMAADNGGIARGPFEDCSAEFKNGIIWGLDTGLYGDDNRDGRIDEDETGWNCRTMGNKLCGPLK